MECNGKVVRVRGEGEERGRETEIERECVCVCRSVLSKVSVRRRKECVWRKSVAWGKKSLVEG